MSTSLLPVPNSLYGFSGRKATFEEVRLKTQELCVYVEVPNSLCGLWGREATFAEENCFVRSSGSE